MVYFAADLKLYPWHIILLMTIIWSCQSEDTDQSTSLPEDTVKQSKIIILGTAQDAGSPQINCKKSCCIDLYKEKKIDRKITSIGLYDASRDQSYLFEATADIAQQSYALEALKDSVSFLDGIFLTHAHIGHYSGLMYLGKEAMDAHSVKTYAMPRMDSFLRSNGPWSQLVERNNIHIQRIANEESIILSDSFSVIPFLVPHRDEYSETVGYKIVGPVKSALFIPDIDKWEKWNKDIVEEISKVDYAFLDATFFDAKEINNRDISEIPHPFVSESIERFQGLSPSERAKVVFIHFNHTNPLLNQNSEEYKAVIKQGFKVARIGDHYLL